MSTQPARPVRRSLVAWTVSLAVLVLVVDQVTKIWAENALAGEGRIPLVGDLLGLVLVYNPGAALSIGTGMTWVLTVLVVVVVAVIIRSLRRLGSLGWAIALGLLLGGAVGNLVDRLTNEPGFARGHVVDFIDYGVFVGNVADIAIVAAAVLIAILALRGVGIDGEPLVDDEGDESPSSDDPARAEPAAVDPTDPENRPGNGPA
ncbi:signal peptidase II [Paraoerskovia marina]|uniref:signal peptidase II n=1 Tax=Paraoerskovia marina TaxID=545619 RepID=UPI0006933E9B|nr:signal peptidase II [Paraoerskovia marina]